MSTQTTRKQIDATISAAMQRIDAYLYGKDAMGIRCRKEIAAEARGMVRFAKSCGLIDEETAEAYLWTIGNKLRFACEHIRGNG